MEVEEGEIRDLVIKKGIFFYVWIKSVGKVGMYNMEERLGSLC